MQNEKQNAVGLYHKTSTRAPWDNTFQARTSCKHRMQARPTRVSSAGGNCLNRSPCVSRPACCSHNTSKAPSSFPPFKTPLARRGCCSNCDIARILARSPNTQAFSLLLLLTFWLRVSLPLPVSEELSRGLLVCFKLPARPPFLTCFCVGCCACCRHIRGRYIASRADLLPLSIRSICGMEAAQEGSKKDQEGCLMH